MIEGGFLGEEDRANLIALARDGLAASRVTRRANALVLLDDGWSCRDVAAALLLDDDTVRNWRKLFEQRGIEGLTSFDMGGSAGFLSAVQEDALKVFVSTTLPRSTRHVGAWIEKEFGLVYESRSGLIALLHPGESGEGSWGDGAIEEVVFPSGTLAFYAHGVLAWSSF
jgi:transposase